MDQQQLLQLLVAAQSQHGQQHAQQQPIVPAALQFQLQLQQQQQFQQQLLLRSLLMEQQQQIGLGRQAQQHQPLMLLQTQEQQQLPKLENIPSIAEVPSNSLSESSLIPSSSSASTSDIIQTSCASNPLIRQSLLTSDCSNDAASVETTRSDTKLIEVDSLATVKAELAAKESSNQQNAQLKSDSKSLITTVPFIVSSDSEDDSDDSEVFQAKRARKSTTKNVGETKKKVSKGSENGCSSEKPSCSKASRPGRPRNSKNKGEKKGDLIKKIELLEKGTVSVINADNPQETAPRSLRSNARNEHQPGKSSNLKQIEIGFDFSPKKTIDPDLLEKIEACIVKSNTSWDDVVGLEATKQRLKEAAVLPIRRPDLFIGIRAASKGVLLYGPPGTGKTMLAKCAASEGNCTFISIRSSDIMSKWIGDAEKAVAALFDVARRKQPSIIFIDEVDSLLSARRQGEHDSIRRIKTEFLTQWDGLSNEDSRIMVLGATNRPMDLDLAAMRRFGQHLYVPLPDIQARKAMFEKFANDKDVKVNLNETDIVLLGLHSNNYSAADITNVLRDASMAPIRELTYAEIEVVSVDQLRSVCRQDVENSLSTIHATCNSDALHELESWNEERSGK